jgi:hypothetical protein
LWGRGITPVQEQVKGILFNRIVVVVQVKPKQRKLAIVKLTHECLLP